MANFFTVAESAIKLIIENKELDRRQLATGLSITVTIETQDAAAAEKIATKSAESGAVATVFASFKTNALAAGGTVSTSYSPMRPWFMSPQSTPTVPTHT